MHGPGNIRQLRHVLQMAIALVRRTTQITLRAICPRRGHAAANAEVRVARARHRVPAAQPRRRIADDGLTFRARTRFRCNERETVLAMLEENRWNVSNVGQGARASAAIRCTGRCGASDPSCIDGSRARRHRTDDAADEQVLRCAPEGRRAIRIAPTTHEPRRLVISQIQARRALCVVRDRLRPSCSRSRSSSRSLLAAHRPLPVGRRRGSAAALRLDSCPDCASSFNVFRDKSASGVPVGMLYQGDVSHGRSSRRPPATRWPSARSASPTRCRPTCTRRPASSAFRASSLHATPSRRVVTQKP